MEAMSVESIIQAYWQIQNYFTIPRFCFEKKSDENDTNWGNYSDIDMLAFKPKNPSDMKSKSTLVLCESKAHGRKNQIIFRDFDKSYSQFEDIQLNHKDGHTKDLIHFIDSNVTYLLTHEDLLNGLVNLNEIEVLKIQFVSTILFHNQEKIKPLIVSHLKKRITPITFDIEVEITTHFDIISRLFLMVQNGQSGKRYGNQILDFIREINRYIHVDKCDGIKAIKKSKGLLDDKIKGDKDYSEYNSLATIFIDKLTDTFNTIDIPQALENYKPISELILGN